MAASSGMDIVLIGLVAVAFLSMGVYALAAPARLIAPFGIELRTPEGRSEVRAVYGGFGIAVAVLLGVAAREHGELRVGMLWVIAGALLGMALGRAFSRVIEAPARFYPIWLYFWVELFGAGMLLLATRL